MLIWLITKLGTITEARAAQQRQRLRKEAGQVQEENRQLKQGRDRAAREREPASLRAAGQLIPNRAR